MPAQRINSPGVLAQASNTTDAGLHMHARTWCRPMILIINQIRSCQTRVRSDKEFSPTSLRVITRYRQAHHPALRDSSQHQHVQVLRGGQKILPAVTAEAKRTVGLSDEDLSDGG
jgi:hypothetical protein